MNKKRVVLVHVFLLFFSFVSYVKSGQQTSNLFEKICFGPDHRVLENVQIIDSKSDEFLFPEKDWTFFLYMSADNDLAPFAIRNIKQMAMVGSNEYFNIVVQLDICKTNGQKITRRYYIEKDNVYHLNSNDSDTQSMDSGSPETLISFCQWAASMFPAKKYGLVLWNHGAGILDPLRYRSLKTEELFVVNTSTQLLEIDRSIGYIDRMLLRGICFDNTTQNYLTNQDLEYALEIICAECLGGKKLEFIGFDACLMQMVEIANLLKKYTHIMIGSQEAGLGYGWNYISIFDVFNNGSIETNDLMHHIVEKYKDSYINITGDYTLSAINLEKIDVLEENINDVAQILMFGLQRQKNGMVKRAIRASKSRLVCTHFNEPSYIDLYHFYENLLANLEYMQLQDVIEENQFKFNLKSCLTSGFSIIEDVVFKNTSGERLSNAHGISIYFPEKIHSSYGVTHFARSNSWAPFLVKFLIS